MNERKIYALGFFDGVHLGHQALLAACRQLANSADAKAGVVTFTSHPDALVSGNAPQLINTAADRKRLLQAYGAEVVVEIPFDKQLMQTHWSDFLQQLIDMGAAGFVCGSDFRFGAGGSGTAEKLAAFCESRGMPYAIVPQQLIGDIRISSTHIRALLEAGDMKAATEFLGHPHVFTGKVVPGRGLGHTLGIPTANMALPEDVICPKHGVYACKALVDGREYLAVTNIGNRPTVAGHHVTVEPWILDFDGDLYGKELTLAFHKFLRPEQTFPTLVALKEQIQLDAAETFKLLR